MNYYLDVIGYSFSCLVRHLDYYLLTFIHASLGIQIITTPKNLSSNQPTPRSVSNMYMSKHKFSYDPRVYQQ